MISFLELDGRLSWLVWGLGFWASVVGWKTDRGFGGKGAGEAGEEGNGSESLKKHFEDG